MSEYHRQRALNNLQFIRHNRKRQHWVVDNDDDDLPPEVHIPHTQTRLRDSGIQSQPTRTTYVSGPASPEKRGSSSRLQPDADEHSYYHEGYIDDAHSEQASADRMETDIEDDESDDDLDPAYRQHLDEAEPGPPKRKRRPRVSTFSPNCGKACSMQSKG